MQRVAAISTVLVLTLACAKQTASDGGGTTTSQSTTESGDPNDTSTSTSSSEDTETDTGGVPQTFVPMEDLAGLCSISEFSVCDEFLQDCPDGEKCVPFHVEDCSFPKCVLVTGDKPAGESCTVDQAGNDDCDADSYCYPGTFDAELSSICTAFCQGTADNSFCDDPSLSCVFDMLVYEGVIGCRPSCNPLLPDACEPGERCTMNVEQEPDFGCVLGDGVADGEVCDDQECGSGTCVDAESLLECAGERCCSPWCDVMAPNCAMGLDCIAIGAADPNMNVGVCSLP